jgi:fucose permease
VKGIWDAVWGLLVEDGSLAVGILVALAITWVAAVLLDDAARNFVGWLLLAMLTALVVLNLQAAARNARRKLSSRSD